MNTFRDNLSNLYSEDQQDTSVYCMEEKCIQDNNELFIVRNSMLMQERRSYYRLHGYNVRKSVKHIILSHSADCINYKISVTGSKHYINSLVKELNVG